MGEEKERRMSPEEASRSSRQSGKEKKPEVTNKSRYVNREFPKTLQKVTAKKENARLLTNLLYILQVPWTSKEDTSRRCLDAASGFLYILLKCKKGERMIYITVKQQPRYKQMSLEELLFGNDSDSSCTSQNPDKMSGTITYEREYVSQAMRDRVDIHHMVYALAEFNKSTENIRSKNRNELYSSFFIPKKSGGVRKIDAPNEELKDDLRSLKRVLEVECGALYHTSAFAYIKNRSTIDSVKRHQQNNSKWFGKLDLSNFFGSITLDFVMKMMEYIFPFSEICNFKYDVENLGGEKVFLDGRLELRKALELGFLDGHLPQGTPLSPTLTNIIMIPVDYKLNKEFLNHGKIYTRYADDFLISSKTSFNIKAVESLVINTLKEFNAPFSINREKTRYGSSAGRNWNLGVMLNKDNEITVGYKKKKHLQNMLTAFIKDSNNGVAWNLDELQALLGNYSYCRMVEGDTIDRIINHINQKWDVDVIGMIKTHMCV